MASTPKAPTAKRTPRPVAPKIPPQPQVRWQRTQRYVWDKGGGNGGRR